MRWQTKYSSALIGAALLLLASLSLLPRSEPTEPRRVASARPTNDIPVAVQSAATERDAVVERNDAAPVPSPIDLRSASETFRNSTLLVAIRRAGFYCADVVSADESADRVWLASCSDMVRYLVTLRGADQYDVHAVAYFDSVAPAPVDRDRSVDPRPPQPESLRK